LKNEIVKRGVVTDQILEREEKGGTSLTSRGKGTGFTSGGRRAEGPNKKIERRIKTSRPERRRKAKFGIG